MSKSKMHSVIARIFALLFFVFLIVLFIIPFRRAQSNTKEEYLDLYRYRNEAEYYYRTLHTALLNLDELYASFRPGIGSNSPSDKVFNTLYNSQNLTSAERYFTPIVRQSFYNLSEIPDPGDATLVNTVNESFEAYIYYRDLLLSAKYDSEDYYEALHDARDKAHRKKRKLNSLIFDK